MILSVQEYSHMRMVCDSHMRIICIVSNIKRFVLYMQFAVTRLWLLALVCNGVTLGFLRVLFSGNITSIRLIHPLEEFATNIPN